jgi:hypothetical protein
MSRTYSHEHKPRLVVTHMDLHAAKRHLDRLRRSGASHHEIVRAAHSIHRARIAANIERHGEVYR